jgi:hypothetical protein
MPGPRPPARPKHDWFSNDEPIVLRLFPEFVEGIVPVFPQSGDTDELIPHDLLTKLIAWSDYFNGNYHWESGWQSGDAKHKWSEVTEIARLAGVSRQTLYRYLEIDSSRPSIATAEDTAAQSTPSHSRRRQIGRGLRPRAAVGNGILRASPTGTTAARWSLALVPNHPSC